MNAASRQALMQKLARIETPPVVAQPMYACSLRQHASTNHVSSMKPTIAQPMTSKSVLLKNMFDPEEYELTSYQLPFLSDDSLFSRETEPDWDKDLADDVKSECQGKYGQVLHIKVEKDTDVISFSSSSRTYD